MNNTAMPATPPHRGGRCERASVATTEALASSRSAVCSQWEGVFFTLPELTHSLQAQAHGIPNVPTAEAVAHLTVLVRDVLDPVREMWGVPIYVTSGYRCKELNKKVGGATNSYHLRGMAADITSRCPFHNAVLYGEIRRMHRKGQIRLTECYLSKLGTYIHIAYDPAAPSENPFFTKL